MTDTRATGWKIPLIFCGVVLGIVGLFSLLRTEPAVQVPEVPAPLLAQARAIVIDLNTAPEGSLWKERITAAGSGFASHADKDTKLAFVIRDAVARQRFDAACTAAVLVYDTPKRDAVLEETAQAAAGDCSTLPWGVMAAHGMRDPFVQARTHEMLTERWNACRDAAAQQQREES